MISPYSQSSIFENVLSDRLDRLLQPEVHCLGKLRSAFHVFSAIGLLIAVVLVMSLTYVLDLSLSVIAGIIATAIFTFFLLAFTIKIITGNEQLVLYQQLIGVIGAIILFLVTLQQPVLPYLDVAILGLGTFVMCGRVGCFNVGCCHGRPSTWGVCYGKQHVDLGFTPYLVGVRLFPIQIIEALWLSIIVLTGTILMLKVHSPGDILAVFTVLYTVGRFCFEFWRGDPERSYFWQFSEAQWLSFLILGAIAAAEFTGLLQFYVWQISVFGFLSAALFIDLVKQLHDQVKSNQAKPYQILRPHHIQEVTKAIDVASPTRPSSPLYPVIGCTSLGLQISTSQYTHNSTQQPDSAQQAVCLCHYSLSDTTYSLTQAGAKTLANLILQLKHPQSPNALIAGNQGVFHLLIYPTLTAGTSPASLEPKVRSLLPWMG